MQANRSKVMEFVYKDEGGFAIRALEPGGTSSSTTFGRVWDRRTGLVCAGHDRRRLLAGVG
jgi:hypothetical protein